MDYAKCRGMDPSLFFPKTQSDRARSEQYQHYAKAVAVCRKCPVKEICLEYAVAVTDDTE
jgi:Transcription factor WhiB